MDLNEATETIRRWLPAESPESWREVQECRDPKCYWWRWHPTEAPHVHKYPCHPASWALAGCLIEIAGERWANNPKDELLTDICQALRTAVPLQAALEAGAAYIQSQETK